MGGRCNGGAWAVGEESDARGRPLAGWGGIAPEFYCGSATLVYQLGRIAKPTYMSRCS